MDWRIQRNEGKGGSVSRSDYPVEPKGYANALFDQQRRIVHEIVCCNGVELRFPSEPVFDYGRISGVAAVYDLFPPEIVRTHFL